jgi:protein archease
MMIKNTESGYKELAHTADLALKVWAPDLAGLFVQAAQGMYALMGVVLAESPCAARTIEVAGYDAEDLLVSFLEEILYQAEMHDEGYRQFALNMEAKQLIAEMCAAPLRRFEKEIKAVTYHGLRIEETAQGLETVIVFDV